MSSYSRYLQQKNSSAIKKYSDYEAYIARKNFDHFCCCLQGGTGPIGPSGAVGLFGGTSIKYSNPSTEGWNNVITPPTGPSQGIRGNNIDATQITKIYASRNDGDNTDVMDVLKILATVKNYEKGIIKITKIDDSSKFIIMKVITVVEQTDYIEYDGSIVMATSSTPFITGEAVVLTITSNGSSELRNELTNENHEFFPLILRDDITTTGSTGATGYTYDGLTINASTKAVSFIGESGSNPNNWSTVFQPGALATQTALNIFASNNYNTSSGMPSAGQINIGKQNSIPFSIDHYGSTQISTAVPSFSGATGPQAQFVLNNTDGILLSTKQQEFTTTATPPDNQQIRIYSNFGNIYLNSTGKGVTGNAVAQGGLFLDSRTVDTTTELSKRENIRQPLYLQAAIDPGPSSQISVDRISGLQMAARTYDTNGTTGGTVQIISQTVDTSRSTSGTDSRAADIERQIQEQQIIIENAETGDADGLAQAQAAKSILETQRATYNTGDPEYSELTAKIDYQQTIITRESRVEDTVTLNAAIAQVVKLENDLRNLPTGAFIAGAKVEPTPKIMGRLAMDNMGNVTLFSGGYTGASGANRQEGKLTLQVAGASGSMELFNEGASGLNITNMGIDGLNLTTQVGDLIINASTGSIKFTADNNITLKSDIAQVTTNLTKSFYFGTTGATTISPLPGLVEITDGTTGTIKLDGSDKSIKVTTENSSLTLESINTQGNRLLSIGKTGTAGLIIQTIGDPINTIKPDINIKSSGNITLESDTAFSGSIDFKITPYFSPILSLSKGTRANIAAKFTRPIRLMNATSSELQNNTNEKLVEVGDIAYDTTTDCIKYMNNNNELQCIQNRNQPILRAIQSSKSLAKNFNSNASASWSNKNAQAPSSSVTSMGPAGPPSILGTIRSGSTLKPPPAGSPGGTPNDADEPGTGSEDCNLIYFGIANGPGTGSYVPPNGTPSFRPVMCCKCIIPERKSANSTDLEYSLLVSGTLSIWAHISSTSSGRSRVNFSLGVFATTANSIGMPNGGAQNLGTNLSAIRNNPYTLPPNNDGSAGTAFSNAFPYDGSSYSQNDSTADRAAALKINGTGGGEGGIGKWPRPIHSSYYTNLLQTNNNTGTGGATGSSLLYNNAGIFNDGVWTDPLGFQPGTTGSNFSGWGDPLKGDPYQNAPVPAQYTSGTVSRSGLMTVSYDIICNNPNLQYSNPGNVGGSWSKNGEQEIYLWLCLGFNAGNNWDWLTVAKNGWGHSSSSGGTNSTAQFGVSTMKVKYLGSDYQNNQAASSDA